MRPLGYYLDTFYDWLIKTDEERFSVDDERLNIDLVRLDYFDEKDAFDMCMHDEKINVQAMDLVVFYDKPFGRSDYVDDVAPDTLWVEDKLNEIIDSARCAAVDLEWEEE